jgi:hypothetical protein
MRAFLALPLLLCAHAAIASDCVPAKKTPILITSAWSLPRPAHVPAHRRTLAIRSLGIGPKTQPLWYEMGEGWSGGFLTKFHSDRPHSGVGLGLRLKF